MSARWRPGSRVERLHASHSYRLVLVMLLGVFVFVMAAPEAAWALGVLNLALAATVLVAMWTSGLGWSATATIVAVAAGVAAAAVAHAVGGDVGAGSAWLIGAVLTVAIVAVIALGVVDQGEVNRQSVVGAICIYILLGLLFSFAYGSAAKLGSGDFFAQGTDGTAAVRLYFSYITMATVGYGDYTAAADLGRAMAVIEALVGQLYLVTVIAVLVSRLGFARR